jgi:hypothetical protein
VRRAALVALAILVASGACRKKSPSSTNPNAANKVAVRSVRLFYESPRMLLVAEPRNIAIAESAAVALPVVIRELLKGPAGPGSFRLLPEDTVLRGAYLLPGGTAIVDLGGPTLVQGWGTGTHRELMAAYSVVETVTANFPEARRVRLLVNGTPTETLGGHVSLSRSLAPMPSLVDGGSPPVVH